MDDVIRFGYLRNESIACATIPSASLVAPYGRVPCPTMAVFSPDRDRPLHFGPIALPAIWASSWLVHADVLGDPASSHFGSGFALVSSSTRYGCGEGGRRANGNP